MVISERMNLVRGRHCDSWVRVIGGRLILFVHGHTPVAGGNTRSRMQTLSVQAWEIPWSEFETLHERARFHHTMRGNIRRHRYNAEVWS